MPELLAAVCPAGCQRVVCVQPPCPDCVAIGGGPCQVAPCPAGCGRTQGDPYGKCYVNEGKVLPLRPCPDPSSWPEWIPDWFRAWVMSNGGAIAAGVVTSVLVLLVGRNLMRGR
jgi:hypothetical protein